MGHGFITGERGEQRSPGGMEEQDTIIEHEEVPGSMWEKGSFPQTEQKIGEDMSCNL